MWALGATRIHPLHKYSGPALRVLTGYPAPHTPAYPTPTHPT
jgi:hypothetical protein